MSTITLEAGDNTEALLAFILQNLSEKELDEVGVTRKQEKGPGLATEPATMSVVLAMAPYLTFTIVRLIERYLEDKRQQQLTMLLIRAYEISPEAGKAVAELQHKHGDIVRSLGPIPKQ